MAKRLHRSGHGGMKVPANAKLVVDKIQKIEAQKGFHSNWPHEFFQHKFIRGKGKIYQLPSSTKIPKTAELIYDKIEKILADREGKKIQQPFKSGKIYGLMNGALMIKSASLVLLVIAPYPLWDTFEYPDE